ncbi:hypothetical protein Tco_0073523 [Tanacetum coccineum]
MNWSCNKYYFSLYLYCNKSSLVDPWSDDQGIDDDDKVPSEEVSQELLAKMTGKGMNWVLTTNDKKQMKNALNDTMRSRCDSREEHHYHLDQMKSYMEKNDLEELNTRWVRKTIKRFNLYARYVVEHWKSLWANQSYIRRQLKKLDDLEEVSSESCVIWERVHDYLLGLESYQVKNSKKEKRIMDIDEIQKFCDVTLKRVLKEMKKINLDVKHGYVDPTFSKDDAKFKVFNEKYIEERLRHRDQMRRWESYVNGRPLQQRWESQE